MRVDEAGPSHSLINNRGQHIAISAHAQPACRIATARDKQMSGMIVAPRHRSHPDCRAPLTQIDAPHRNDVNDKGLGPTLEPMSLYAFLDSEAQDINVLATARKAARSRG